MVETVLRRQFRSKHHTERKKSKDADQVGSQGGLSFGREALRTRPILIWISSRIVLRFAFSASRKLRELFANAPLNPKASPPESSPVLFEPTRRIFVWTRQPIPPKLANNTLGGIGDGAQNQLLRNKN